MRRTLLLAALTLLLLVLGTTLIVQVRSVDEPLPAPDVAMPIHLEDGTVLPLAEVLARAQVEAVAPPAPPPELPAAQAPPAQALRPDELAVAERVRAEIAAQSSVFHMAQRALLAGRNDEALALYQSIPEDDPDWASAQRQIGWHILTKGRGDPRRAVPYVQAALRREPLEGNSWQDLARVYAGTLGFDVD